MREEKTQKVKDLSYTIVDEEDIPQALLDTIEEKKAAECKLTYETDDALYVVHGYGEQETGGYSIAVKEFYLTGNATGSCRTAGPVSRWGNPPYSAG